MDRIERYVARMNRLIGDLVDVASIDAGKLAVHLKPGDAAELIAEAIAPFAQAAAGGMECIDVERRERCWKRRRGRCCGSVGGWGVSGAVKNVE